MSNNIVALVLGIGLLVYGLYRLFLLFKRRKFIEDSKSWPSTSGTVTDSGTKYTIYRRGKHYWAEIGYRYTALGLENNATTKIDSLLGLQGAANERANAHPIGSTFSVRYNPNQVQEHVADFEKVTGSDLIKVLFFLIFGILFIIIYILSLAPK